MCKHSIHDKSIHLTAYTGEPDNTRYRTHYGWLHIAGDPKISKQVNPESDEFQLAILWYWNYRHMYYGNDVLDDYIERHIDKMRSLRWRDYNKHYREYLLKGVHWFGWGELEPKNLHDLKSINIRS